MKNFSKKSILRKTIISILIAFILVNVTFPMKVKAAGDSIGDSVMSLIQRAIVGIGDAAMWISNFASGENVKAVYILNKEYVDTNANTVVQIGQAAVGMVKNITNYVDLPNFEVTVEKIFSNEVPMLDVNIINPNPDHPEAPVYQLQYTISSWYKAFRNLAVVGLLSVLVYTAIRIILASASADKAKYKAMFKDWLVAMFLVFFMHYIMSFSVNMVAYITEELKVNINSNVYKTNKTKDDFNGYDQGNGNIEAINKVTNGGTEPVTFYSFSEFTRFLASGGDWGSTDEGERLAYTLMYLVMAFYTITFLYKYIKRLVNIIFLTMIAPLVAFTYPLDKMKDGSAQGFNHWFKEYMLNLIMQPLHLLLYIVLVTSVAKLSTQYLVYQLVVLAFMLPAEKLLRSFFGLDKSTTAGNAMSGAIGGALAMKAVGGIKNLALGFGKLGKGSSGGGNNGNGENNKINFNDDRRKDKGAPDLIESHFDEGQNSNHGSAGAVPIGSSAGGQGNNNDVDDDARQQYIDYNDARSNQYDGGSAGYTSGNSMGGTTGGSSATPIGSSGGQRGPVTGPDGHVDLNTVPVDAGGKPIVPNGAGGGATGDSSGGTTRPNGSSAGGRAPQYSLARRGIRGIKGVARRGSNYINNTRPIKGIKKFGKDVGKFTRKVGGSVKAAGSVAYNSKPIRGIRAVGGAVGAEAKRVGNDVRYAGGKISAGATKVGNKARNIKNKVSNSVPGRVVKAGASGAKYVLNSKTVKWAAKTAVKGAAMAAGGVVLGTVGVAAGLASDDFDKVWQYGAAGLGAGTTVGGVAGNAITKIPSKGHSLVSDTADSVRGFGSAVQEGWYGGKSSEAYQKHINQVLDKKHKKDSKVREKYKLEIGHDGNTYYDSKGRKIELWEKALNDADAYRAQGIKDDDLIIKAEKAAKKAGYDFADKRGIIGAKLSKEYKDEDQIRDMGHRLQERYKTKDTNKIREMQDIVRNINGKQ